jgi:hypothetical protein
MSWFSRIRSRWRRGGKLRLEIHVPISPTPFFFNRIHYLATSLQLNAGPLADTKIVVTIGADAEAFDPRERLPWSRHFNIEWRWLPRELFQKHSYFATRLQRLLYDYQAEVVMLLDADVLVVAAFDDLLARVVREQKLFGVPANASPIRNDFTWENLFTRAALGPVPYAVEHSGFGCTFHEPQKRMAPPYFNLGVIPMPADVARRLGETIFHELTTVASCEDFFRAQMSLTLALVRQRIPWGTMSFKYNFVNDERYLPRYRKEFADMRLLHFLSNRNIHKDKIFASVDAVEQAFRAVYKDAVDRKFIEILRPIHQEVLKRL